MIKSIFKSIVGGIVLGTLAFFASTFVFVLLIAGLLWAIFTRRKFGEHHFMDKKLAFAAKVRSMNDDEFEAFKSNLQAKTNHCSNHCC